MSFSEKKISVSDLSLWDENARFPDNFLNIEEEDELIHYIVSKPSFKIKELIDEIVRDFDLPHLEKLVVWDNLGQLVVLEGNRRLTAYRLLVEPEKASKIDSELYNFLLEKKLQIPITSNFKLDCLISKDKNQCFRYIDRKHSKSNNEVNWLEPERINYSKRRGNESYNTTFKIAINNFVKSLDLPNEIKDKVLGQGFVTTFYRFITSGAAKELFGLDIDEKGNLKYTDIDFPKKFKVIIHNIIMKLDFEGKKVDTRVYNKKEQIKQYLESIKSEDVVKVDADIQQNTHTNLFGNSNVKIGSQKKPRKTSKTEQNEILFGRTLELKKGKVNDFYLAISNIYNQNQHNESMLSIIGMSLRLLVEISARVYYEGTADADKDKIYDTFLKQAKKDMKLAQESKNFLSLTGSWLENNTNIEALLGKYAHGNIITTKSDILTCSNVIGDVLMYYFKR